MLGFSTGVMDDDDTSKRLISYLFYHSIRILIAFIIFIACIIVFLMLVLSKDDIVLTYPIYFPVMFGFMALYWFYYEFEYVYRVYLFYWGSANEQAEKGYNNDEDDLTKPVEN